MFKALIVDDEVDMWFMISGILRQNKIRTNFVNNLAAARQSLQKEIPAVLFVDHHLVEGLALKFIRFVKGNYPQTKIVVITAGNELAACQKVLTDGADFFMSKPFNSEMINTAIKKVLNLNPHPFA